MQDRQLSIVSVLVKDRLAPLLAGIMNTPSLLSLSPDALFPPLNSQSRTRSFIVLIRFHCWMGEKHRREQRARGREHVGSILLHNLTSPNQLFSPPQTAADRLIVIGCVLDIPVALYIV